MRRAFTFIFALGLALALIQGVSPRADAAPEIQWRAVASPRMTEAAAHLKAMAVDLKAQGFKNVTLAQSTHSHLLDATSPSWHQSPTVERWFRIRIGINHTVDTLSGTPHWTPRFDLECRRSGGITVPCNFELNYFRALGWISHNGLTMKVYGTANPGNSTCVAATALTGQDRLVEDNYPYVGSELDYIRVRFLNNFTDCSHLHLSNIYRARSYRTAAWESSTGGMFDFENDYVDSKTGLWVK